MHHQPVEPNPSREQLTIYGTHCLIDTVHATEMIPAHTTLTSINV